jgi:hypothetical protein
VAPSLRISEYHAAAGASVEISSAHLPLRITLDNALVAGRVAVPAGIAKGHSETGYKHSINAARVLSQDIGGVPEKSRSS